jgi:hypothetical protein
MHSTPLHPESPQPVSHKHVLLSEILAVTSAMRKNSRWASTTHFVNARDSALASNLGLRFHNAADAPRGSASANRENDLMFGFQELKRTIRGVDGALAFALTCLYRSRTVSQRCRGPPIVRSPCTLFCHHPVPFVHGSDNLCSAFRSSQLFRLWTGLAVLDLS